MHKRLYVPLLVVIACLLTSELAAGETAARRGHTDAPLQAPLARRAIQAYLDQEVAEHFTERAEIRGCRRANAQEIHCVIREEGTLSGFWSQEEDGRWTQLRMSELDYTLSATREPHSVALQSPYVAAPGGGPLFRYHIERLAD